ncbi:hypothetical protein JCM5350_004291 [Sporobolomyces pararoseus]
MHAKSYRAPSQGERLKEANDRYRLDAINYEEKRLKETNRLLERQQQLSRRSGGLQVPPSSYGTLGGRPPFVRGRSRSFNGFASGTPYLGAGYSSPSIALGGRLSPRLGSYGHTVSGDRHLQQVELERRRLKEAQLASLRARRDALELETERRIRNSSILARERQAQTQYLGSPQLLRSPVLPHSPYRDSYTPHGHTHHHTLAVPQYPPQPLRRTRSFGSIPFGTSSTPLHHHHYPHASPQLQPLPPSPRVVKNYTIYNDPHETGSHFGGFERAGGHHFLHHDNFDRLPPVDHRAHDYDAPHAGALGGSEFVISDLDYDENGRQILSELGWVEGDSSRCDSFTAIGENELLNFAIQDLTANARQKGANAVLGVEAGEDAAGRGIVILRGRAVVLS